MWTFKNSCGNIGKSHTQARVRTNTNTFVGCPRTEKDKEHDVPHQTICKMPQIQEGGLPE